MRWPEDHTISGPGKCRHRLLECSFGNSRGVRIDQARTCKSAAQKILGRQLQPLTKAVAALRNQREGLRQQTLKRRLIAHRGVADQTMAADNHVQISCRVAKKADVQRGRLNQRQRR